MKIKILSSLLLIALLFTAIPVTMPATVASAAETPVTEEENYVDLDTLYVKEGLTSHFSVFGENASTVDLTAGTWTDLVAGKKATFSYGETNYWKKKADGSVGYTTFRGALAADGRIASAATDNERVANNRLQFGLDLLPAGDFSVEYLAMYQPVYVYDETEEDKIAKNKYGIPIESYGIVEPAKHHVELPIDQLGWFTAYTTYLDNTKHLWGNGVSVERGSVHWFFDCPGWNGGNNTWYVGGLGHVPGAGLNITTDAFQHNNEINTYGIYLDETLTTAEDGTRTTTALFSLYRNASLYNSNASNLNSTANAKGGTTYYDIDTAFGSNHNFWLSSTRATNFYTVRIYDRALSDAEKKQNRSVDILHYYNIKIPEAWAEDSAFLTRVFDALADEEIVSDPLARPSRAYEIQNKVNACYPVLEDVNALYVQNGLFALYTAYVGDSLSLTETKEGILWQNHVESAPDALFEKDGWTYNSTLGGVGYDLIYGTVDTAAGTFSTACAQDTYARGNRLHLGLSLLPKEDFTLEYVAYYSPVLSYDIATDALVDTYATGISTAVTPVAGVYEPVDTVGFLSSQTTQHGGLFNAPNISAMLGLLRWRSVDKQGHGTWEENGYGWGNTLVTINRASRTVETYAITRDEETTESAVTATYTHLLNGAYVDAESYSSVNTTGENRYYTFEDDTDFYLSYKLGTTFYALRVYDRVLTEAEQKQNRAVDILRYYDVSLPSDALKDETAMTRVYPLVADAAFLQDAFAYAAEKARLQYLVTCAVQEDASIASHYAQSEHLTALFTVYRPETVDLSAGTWTDLVAGKTASFSYGGTNYWKKNANGSVGYTSFRGAISDNAVVASATTDNYQNANNRLQFGISLLPASDFSVEYFAMYKPLYIYDENEADKIARDAEGNLRETYQANLEVKLHVTYPIDQLGWFTSVTSLLDTTKHYWKPSPGTAYADRTDVLQRGSVHWFYNCHYWSYDPVKDTKYNNQYYVGANGSHTPDSGLNVATDAFQHNNEINTYGIYLDETLTVAQDGTRTTTALFSLYRNASLYNSNASYINTTERGEDARGGYVDINTPYITQTSTTSSSTHNFWLSSTRATDFFTVRVYDIALSDADRKYNYAVDLILYYGIALTEEMWANETYMTALTARLAEERAVTGVLEKAAWSVFLQDMADAVYEDVLKLEEMQNFYAKPESLKAFFTAELESTIDISAGRWYDCVGGVYATLGNASKGYWKVRADGAVGYDVIYGEISADGTGQYSSTSVYNNYSDRGTRLEFGIDLLPKGDFTVEYLAEYRPVYAADVNGTPAVGVYDYGQGASLPDGQQYGGNATTPVDQFGFFHSWTTQRDSGFNGNGLRGDIHWCYGDLTHASASDGWSAYCWTQGFYKSTEVFATRNSIRSYAVSRAEAKDAEGLVTACYTLSRDAVTYATGTMNRDTFASNDNNTKGYTLDFANDDTGYFYLSERISTDFYAVRIYDTALTAANYAQNRFVDLLYFYDVDIPAYLTRADVMKEAAALATDINFAGDSFSYISEREDLLALLAEFDEIASENTLYVQDGLVSLFTAFAGDETLLSASGANIVWKNRVLGQKDATFEKTGWTYNSTLGGVGYKVVYGTVDMEAMTFSETSLQNTYDNGNKLSLGLSLLPKDDYTVEYVAYYSPVYSVDAKTGDLVETYQTGIDTAKTPNKITQWPDVIGMIHSVTTQHGGNFAGALGGLRWRVAPKACFSFGGGWGGYYNDPTTNIGVYGQGTNLVTTNRATGVIGTYALTRDEEITVTGETREVTACYTHLLDGTVAATDNYSTANQGASDASLNKQYYNQDDDTDFYLSYKLGTTFYALRVYDRVLTEAEQKQNRIADLLGYYDIAVSDGFLENNFRYEYVASLCETLCFEQDEDAYKQVKERLQDAVTGSDKLVTLAVGEKETSKVLYDKYCMLPTAVADATLFAWYKLDAEGNVVATYAPGETAELTERETTFRALILTAPETKYGVSVKTMAADGFGMRFTATVARSEISALIAEYGRENIRISMLITPQRYVQRAGAFTREALWSYVNANATEKTHAFVEIPSNGFYTVDEDVCTIAGTLYRFTDVTIQNNLSFAAIACIDVDTDGDGTVDKTVYGTYTGSTCRSPKSMVESINYMGIQMTDTQKKWVDDFLKNYTDRTYGSKDDKTVAKQRQEIQEAFEAAMNTTVDYTVHPFAEGEVDAKYAHIQAISFDGLDVNGKKTRIFAYVGLPEGASAENPVPAMVLVHGGGGHAYMEWVRLWNERGYAAIAMENTGYFPTSPGISVTEDSDDTTRLREFPDYILDVIDESEYTLMPTGNNRFTTSYAEVDEQWQYHGLASVILSHNVLLGNAAIDPYRIGTIGVSWGGTMVSQVIGYDTRFAFAIPIYGTAYLGEPERPFGSYGNAYVDDLWAAERNLDNFKNPIMWFAWADDNNFVMNAYTKSYLHSKKNNPKTTLVVLANWRHSHKHAWSEEYGYAFADSICFPEESADYATFLTQPTGQNVQSRLLLPEGATNVAVRYHYLTEPMVYKTYTKYFESNWLTEEWKTDSGTLTIDPATGVITGTIPEEVRSYYISVVYTVDGRTFEASSSFVMIR